MAATGRERCRLRMAALLATLLLTWVCGSAADYPLTIIDLRHRLPEDVIPILAPLAGADGVVTGANNSLFVRAAPGRLADIRAALRRIDHPPRNLLVEVRRSSGSTRSGTGIGVSIDEPVGEQGRVRIGDGRGTGVRIDAGRERYRSEILQQVRVLDGGQAFISVGTERPQVYRSRTIGPDGRRVQQGIDYRRAETGFYVRPRVNGEHVELELSSRGGRFERGGTLATETLDTRVSGRLGSWIGLGGGEGARAGRRTGLGTSGTVDARAYGELELRVTPID